jgi:hypothetical protein
MKKLFLLALILLCVGGGIVYYYWQNNTRLRAKVIEIVGGEQIKRNNPPEELQGQFDPTVTRGVYSLGQKNQNEKTIVLTMVWPKLEGVVPVTCRLECEGTITLIGEGKEKTITVNEFWGDQRVQEMAVLVSGLCGDKSCQNLVSACNVNVEGNVL